MNALEAHAIVVWLNRAGLLWAAEGQAEVWAESLSDVDGHLGLQAAKDLARNRTSGERPIVPGDIRERVLGLRRDRIRNVPPAAPPEELADRPRDYQRWQQVRAAAIGDGLSPADADRHADSCFGIVRTPHTTLEPHPYPGEVRSIDGSPRVLEA